ncbi:MAG: cytochrome c biogenesis protein ResB [Phycisphaerales bacterium]|nr:MAG: cytochrome c biogenesis protein ResB [Phycisphaerales bacterium]
MNPLRSIVFALASLRFAAVLLMMTVVAMAYATFYEMSHGSALTRYAIYDAWWFRIILGLIAANMTLAVAVRFPFTKRQIGFVITHGSILIILGGAVLTGAVGIRGHVTLREGRSADRFTTENETLILRDSAAKQQRSVRLDLGGIEPVDNPRVPALALDEAAVRVLRYFPDCQPEHEVVNDGPDPSVALEVAVVRMKHEHVEWLFPDRRAQVGPLTVEARSIAGGDELSRLLAAARTADPDEGGTLEVTIGEKVHKVALMENLGKTVPVGDGQVQLEIAHYFPHAKVGPDGLGTVSNRPVNPAAVVYVIRGEHRERRFCFALHPEFTHGVGPALADVKVRLTGITTTEDAPPDVQLLMLPDGNMHALFSPSEAAVTDTPVAIGSAVETPWPSTTLTVRRRFDRARLEHSLAPVIPARETPWPGLELEVVRGDARELLSLRKGEPATVMLGDKTYQLRFENEKRDLGFSLTLEKFTIGTYPGTQRARSFESRVTITDGKSGQTLAGVISMNAPLEYGGYALFQSGYDQEGGTFSTLSVARDPGMWVVFVGYVLAVVGMIVVLITRISVHRRVRALMNE